MARDKVGFEKYKLIVFVLLICFMDETLTETMSVNVSGNLYVGKVDNITVTVDGKQTMKQVASFMGIPYAQPPVGDLRFAKPLQIKQFNETFNATEFGPLCIQDRTDRLPTDFPMSEDCLHINIFVSKDGNRGKPVIVFLHGDFGAGDFRDGGSNFYPGETLAAYSEAVVVTLNYRIGTLGFFNTGEEQFIGNLGLWDQHAALRWVNTHISSFGGSKFHVSLVGHQTGAICALYQAMYTGNKGLFQRVVAQSGSPLTVDESSNGPFFGTTSKQAADAFGCQNTDGTTNAQCMRDVALEGPGIHKYIHSSTQPFTPVYDGVFIKDNPAIMLNESNKQYQDVQDFFKSLNMIIGHNNMDGLAQMMHIWKQKFSTEYNKHLNLDPETFSVDENMFEFAINDTLVKNNFWNSDKDRLREHMQQKILDRYENVIDPDVKRDMLLQFSTDIAYMVPVLEVVKSRKAVTDNVSEDDVDLGTFRTYLYKFAAPLGFKFRRLPTPSWASGANNGDELPFLFGFSRNMLDALNVSSSYVPTVDEMRLSRQLIKKWANFARNGNVNSEVHNVGAATSSYWPSCFDAGGNGSGYMANLTYMEFSLGAHTSLLKTKFGGSTGEMWTSFETYINEGSITVPGELSLRNEGDWLGLEANTAETIIIILIVVIVLLLLILFVTCCCCCRKSSAGRYDSLEMRT